ncbi:hypothetical protein PybrP1_001860 [[Pythium] brassicae (nom. inval.)]|nr:hypothetical protein PybrP1_001860 [[Pythium] brassicae (nom. inval.)]
MHAFRSALSSAQRQLTGQRAAFAVAAAASATVPTLSAAEWMDNIRQSAEKGVFIKKTKLASFLKTVTTSEELEASKEIMKIYEQKRVDPDSNAAGLFVKKALELDAANVAFDVLAANYRIGLFLEPSTLNKLLSKFLKDGDFDKVFQLHEIGSKKYRVKSTDRTYDILIRCVCCVPAGVNEMVADRELSVCVLTNPRVRLLWMCVRTGLRSSRRISTRRLSCSRPLRTSSAAGAARVALLRAPPADSSLRLFLP